MKEYICADCGAVIEDEEAMLCEDCMAELER